MNMPGLGQQHQISTCFIGEAYPPCMLPLSCLVPIPLRDLMLETQHRGRVLIVKTFCEPLRMTSIQNAIEDELGDVDRVSIYNLLPTVAPNKILPCGAIIAVKEPYYKLTADGGPIVRVDHPSDFVLLKPDNKSIPTRLAPQITKVDLSALSLREAGNAAFKRGDWQWAVDCYSDALEADSPGGNDDDLWRTLHRNRSGAHLRLDHYELTITDALAAIIPPENTSEAAKIANIKAFYRAGKAAYGMGDFHQAKKHFEQALRLDANHKEARAEFNRVGKRLAEQENGDYDFSAMAKSATKHHNRLDHASFLKNTEIAPAGRRGRGLFATKPLNPSDIVFVEKAFSVAHTEDTGDTSLMVNINNNRISIGSQAVRLYGIIDKILWNPILATKYLDLSDGGKFGDDKQVKVIDGKVVVDTFQVQSIAEVNGFGCPRVKSSDEEERKKKDSHSESSTGIWLHASYTNHSCLPNVHRAFIGDMMVVRALKDLRAGEEIFMGYTNPARLLGERQKRLRAGYDFDCDCVLCRAEVKVHKTIMEKRARLYKEVVMFLSANVLTNDNVWNVTPAKKAKAKKLLEEMRRTYPQALFENLPRLGCVAIGLWVSKSAPARVNDSLSTFLGVLGDSGYFVTIQGKNVTIDRGSAVAMEEAIHAAMYAAQVLAAMGNEEASSALETLAKDVYTANFGVDQGFETEFPRT